MDVLKRHAPLIAVAERGQSEGRAHVVGLTCIRDLAAALRTERERVAELEPDAKLGSMVREMPKETHLIHSVYGDWWYGRNVRGEFGRAAETPEAALEAARKEET